MEPATSHFFWHVAKSITKKLLQVGRESGCDLPCEVAKGHKEPFALVCYLHQTWIWGANFSKVEVHY